MISVTDTKIIDKIIKIIKNGGGEIYEKDGYLNLFGVRNNKTDNSFNDILYIFWKNSQTGKFDCVKTSGFTTKPGKDVVLGKKARNSNGGAAILKEGWQKDIWHIGKHKGKYTALRSTDGYTKPTVITRDNSQYDKGPNYELRIFTNKTYTGHYGINFHKSGDPKGNNVNDWSAGCQVFQYKKEFDEAMAMVTTANKKGQKTFSYFLTNKTVFDNDGVVDNSNTSYDFQQSQFAGSMSSSGTSSSGAYGGCGGVYQLGNYTNCPDAQIEYKQTQNRDDVLNTLVKGSYTPNEVKKCSELLSTDKKKGIKIKSEN